MSVLADYGPSNYDIRMVQGDTFSEAMLMEDADGDPIDLTGYTFASQLRRTPDGPLVSAFATSVNLSTSTVTRTLSPAVTSGLDGEYVHDFQWTDPSGKIRTLFAGSFEVIPEVTR